MQQIKLFRGIESELARVEGQINQWLAQSGARVIQMSATLAPQSPALGAQPHSPSLMTHAPSDVLVVILYEKA